MNASSISGTQMKGYVPHQGQDQNQLSEGNSLAVQWLGLLALTAEGPGSIPGPGTKIPQATQRGQKNQSSVRAMLIIQGNI